MLTRHRERIVLLAGLLAVNALLGGQLHRQWKAYRERTRWIHAGGGPEVVAGPAETAPRVPAQAFGDIVERNLFVPERASAPGGATQQPDLPILYGVMNLGTSAFALMAPAEEAQTGRFKRVLPGEEIGGYKLANIAGSKVVVEWGEKQFPLDVAESAQRGPRRAERTAATPAAAAPAASRVTPVTTPVPVTPSARAFEEERKKFTPAGYNAPPGAPVDAPAGTIFGGKRKVVRKTPFGDQVWWEDLPKESPKESEKKEK